MLDIFLIMRIKLCRYALCGVCLSKRSSSNNFIFLLQQNIVVNVVDVNEAISSLAVEWNEVDGVSESSAIGQILGKLTVTDPDKADKISCQSNDLVLLRCREQLLCRSFDVVLHRNLDFEAMGKEVDIRLNCSDGKTTKQKVRTKSF